MEQLPCEKGLERLRLPRFQEELTEAGVGIIAEVCQIVRMEDKVKAERISAQPLIIQLLCLKKLVED